jgi:hypothetical protein
MGKHTVKEKQIDRHFCRLQQMPLVRKASTGHLRPGGGRSKPAGIYFLGDGPYGNQLTLDIVGGGCAQQVIVTLDVDTKLPTEKAEQAMKTAKNQLIDDLGIIQ